jgi:hypothetical protein
MSQDAAAEAVPPCHVGEELVMSMGWGMQPSRPPCEDMVGWVDFACFVIIIAAALAVLS